MADRTVKVRLEADISDFVSSVGVKAVAAVKTLERAADGANKRISTVGRDTKLADLGTKADAVGTKLDKAGAKGEASGKRIAAGADTGTRSLGKLADAVGKVNAATDAQSKAIDKASKVADSHANALGRLRVAQLRLAEAQKAGKTGASLAGAEESVKSAERAVKKFEEAGERSGKGFGAGLRRWITGQGSDLGKAGGTVFGSGFIGALKTPIIGPALIAGLLVAIQAAAPPLGAIVAGALVAGAGAGLSAIGLKFAAESQVVGHIWSTTVTNMGVEMRSISKPFESTLTVLAAVAQRTFAKFKPQLAAAFKDLAPVLSGFGDQLGQALEQLTPAIRPLSQAFAAVLANLGPAIQSAVGNVSRALIQLAESVQRSPAALADLVRGIGDITADLLNFLRVMNDANEAFRRWTGGVSGVTALMSTLRGAVQLVLAPIEGLATALSSAGDGMNWLAGKLGIGTQVMSQGGAAAGTFSGSLLKTANSMTASTNAALHNAHATHQANVAAYLAATAYERQSAATDKLVNSLFRLQNIQLQLSGAQISYQAAIDAATQSIKDNGKTLDINTEKGRNNRQALDEVARSANDQTEAMIRSNKGTVAAAAAATASRAGFVKLATQMGLSKAQAQALAAQLIAIPNVTRTAKLTANIQDLQARLATAKKELADPNITKTRKAELKAEISKLQAGIAAAKAALASVPTSKTTTITVNTYRNMVETTTHLDKGVRTVNADGGYYPKGIPSYANGKLPDQAMIAPGKGRGMVQWAEGETGGEAFIPLAPSKRDRSEKILGQVANKFGMGLVKSFANGGILPGGQLITLAQLLQRLGVPFDPTGGANYSATLTAANRANRAVVPARNNAITAQRAEDQAKAQVTAIQRAIQLQQRAVTAARAPKQISKAGQAAEDRRVAAEQKKLIALQDQLYAAKQRVTKATKASNAADALLKIRQDAAAKAVQANRDALDKLVQQQQAAVDMAKQISDGLQSSGNIGDLFQKSLTGKGLLADLQDQGAALAKFRTQIDQLRKAGLSEDLIQQLVAKGADQGGSAAGEILAGGLSLINALNRAQANLEAQANLIGAGSAAVKYGVQVAGKRALGGAALPGKAYVVGEEGPEILRMGVTRGWVEPNRYVTNQSTFTRSTTVQQHNTFIGVSMAEADLIASRAQAKAELALRGY